MVITTNSLYNITLENELNSLHYYVMNFNSQFQFHITDEVHIQRYIPRLWF